MVVSKAWARTGIGSLLFSRYRVSVWEDEKSSGEGWLHNNVNVLITTKLNWTLKND